MVEVIPKTPSKNCNCSLDNGNYSKFQNFMHRQGVGWLFFPNIKKAKPWQIREHLDHRAKMSQDDYVLIHWYMFVIIKYFLQTRIFFFFWPLMFSDTLVYITLILPEQSQYKHIHIYAPISSRMCAGCGYSSSNKKYTGVCICSGQL